MSYLCDLKGDLNYLQNAVLSGNEYYSHLIYLYYFLTMFLESTVSSDGGTDDEDEDIIVLGKLLFL